MYGLTSVKVRQSRNNLFKPTFPPKNERTNSTLLQWNLDLRKPDLRKNLDLRKIVCTTNFLVHKLFDLRKIF